MSHRPTNEVADGPTGLTQELAMLGIIVAPTCGSIASRGDWLVVGTIVFAGLSLNVIPREGLTGAQRSRLYSAVVQVWLHGRHTLHGWAWWPEIGWVVDVAIRQPGHSERRREINSSTCESEGGTPRVWAGLSRPSTV